MDQSLTEKTSIEKTRIRDFDPTSVPKPPDLEAFDWSKTQSYIGLEIGCGNGMHPVQWSLLNPAKSLIAIEQTQNKFAAFRKRLHNYPQLTDLIPIRADAVWWCSHNLPGHLLDEILILYPNPNPKKSQANKRFHNMPFMGFLLNHLREGGKLTLASNVSDYIVEAKQAYVSNWDLTLQDQSQIAFDSPPRTAFEKKYLERKETCTNLVFVK